jgi:hypothetical protein
MTDYRREKAKQVRDSASQKAYDRVHPDHVNNGDEQRYASANYAMSFTKGLDHNLETGLVDNASDFEAFRSCIDNGFVAPFTRDVPVPRDEARRQWEAPTAGVVYELQGPDPQAVTMPPAPELCSDELSFEMAEVYELALLRDVPFNAFDQGGGSADLNQSITRLNDLEYAKSGFNGRPRKTDAAGKLNRQTAFRGGSPGVEKGPYLSQFMLIGNQSPDSSPDNGYINYGAQRIDQRVLEVCEKDDYMMTWAEWHRVQQGYDVSKGKKKCDPPVPTQAFTGKRRFIYTPRDLATYVHIDALYQAYLNACLILLSNGAPFDPGFGVLSGQASGILDTPSSNTYTGLNAGGFALWGGPHILSLVTEVATRGLKAVRYQKFNNHVRLRPEALAARLEKAEDLEKCFPSLCGCFTNMKSDLKKTLKKIADHNRLCTGEESALLPMAFAEGSPMHPAYGAGHATVAGACVTILKAFFDTSSIFVKIDGRAGFFSKQTIAERLECGAQVHVGAYQSKNSGKKLDFDKCGEFKLVKKKGKEGKQALVKLVPEKGCEDSCCPLTLEGELNKLAANISIGRNMAGVHYFSDYYDSARMGEEIAIGILEEQALGYTTDPFVLSVPTFDGGVRRIGRR